MKAEKRSPKRKLMPMLLEALQRGAETTAALFDAMTSGYGASYRKLRRIGQYGPPSFRTDWASAYVERKEFYNLLNRLKRDGIIEKEGKLHHALWRLTTKGAQKLARFRSAPRIPLPTYQNKRDATWRVVTYDVPEREREKRVWIRAALISLQFSPLQESVWVGARTISSSFLRDLKEMRMLKYVQIFEIRRRGTITLIKR